MKIEIELYYIIFYFRYILDSYQGLLEYTMKTTILKKLPVYIRDCGMMWKILFVSYSWNSVLALHTVKSQM